ncbi:MAG: glycosyltransferase family 4 protein [Planctomycetes bacterium]|nr:glycosyltransferase family 4 protein [Planctomycetota bacterium]
MPHDLPSGFDSIARPRTDAAGAGRRTQALRIAVVRQQYRAHGGAERFVTALATVLEEQGHHVTLIARNWSGWPNVIRCDPPRFGRIGREWGFARAVLRELARRDFDLVQCHERIPGCEVYRAGDGVHREWLRQRRRVLSWPARLWLTVSPFHRYVLRAEKALYHHPNLRLVICNSRMVMRDILEHFQMDPAKLRVVYNGVDTRRFHPSLRRYRRVLRAQWGVGPEASVFLFVGSGFEIKGLRSVLAALGHVEGAHLVVVGRDKALPRFRRAANRLGIGPRVHFAGVQRDVAPFYGAADAFVLPSLYDSFPNAVLEAMATGLPVITSTKCGGAELIREGRSGYVCDALDIEGLSCAMRRLTDPNRRREMGQEARRTVEPLTPAAMRDRLLHIYHELLDEIVRAAA